MSIGFPANELWGNGEPLCPYCKKNYDMSDLQSHDGDVRTVECENCTKKFTCQTRVELQYDTVGDCKSNGEMPHELKHSLGLYYKCLKCQEEFYEWQLDGGQYPKLKKQDYVFINSEKQLEIE